MNLGVWGELRRWIFNVTEKERERALFTMMLAHTTHTMLHETACEDCGCACFEIVECRDIMAGEPEVVVKSDFDNTPSVRCRKCRDQ